MKQVKDSYKRLLKSNKNKKILDEHLTKIKTMGRAQKSALAIFNILKTKPKITTSELVKLTNLTKETVCKTIKALKEKEIVCPMTDKERNQIYCLSQIEGTAKELFACDMSLQNKAGVYLSFAGRTEAIAEADKPTKIKFRPDAVHNRKPNNHRSPNSLYVCDNIDLLKYLVKTKYEPFHLIFGDVVYNQKESRKPRQYQDTYDEHAGYLQFMYPRLMLCKKLLDDKGLLVLAVGEDEVANTKLICSEIFPNGFLNTIVVESGVNAGIYSSHSDKFIADTKFYLLVFAKDRKKIRFLNRLYDLVDKKFAKEYNTIITEDLKHEPLLDRLKQEEWVVKEFEDHKLKLTLNNIGNLMEVSQQFETYIYEEIAPFLYKSTSPFKTYAKEAQNQPQNTVFSFDDKLLLKTENDVVVEFKPFLQRLQDNDGKKQNAIPRGTVWKNYQMFKNSIKKQGGLEFAGKKPLRLMMDLLHWINNKNARILDAWCGLGTTGYAVYAQNKKDGGHRSFVLCQIAEPIKEGSANPQNFDTIDQQTIFGLNNAIKETGTTEGYKIFRGTKS